MAADGALIVANLAGHRHIQLFDAVLAMTEHHQHLRGVRGSRCEPQFAASETGDPGLLFSCRVLRPPHRCSQRCSQPRQPPRGALQRWLRRQPQRIYIDVRFIHAVRVRRPAISAARATAVKPTAASALPAGPVAGAASLLCADVRNMRVRQREHRRGVPGSGICSRLSQQRQHRGLRRYRRVPWRIRCGLVPSQLL